jgi:hypothetical protein
MADENIENERPVDGLDRLYERVTPNAHLEERVVGALAAKALVHRASPFRRWRPIGIAAAVILSFGIGWGSSRLASTPQVSAKTDRWVMLLYQTPGAASHDPERVAEYRTWAAQARDSGVVITGERLDNGGWSLSWDVPQGHWFDSTAVSGYFVVQASDYQKALTIARTCPHVKYGGKIELRRIVPT